MSFHKINQHRRVINRLRDHLLSEGYQLLDPCAYELLRLKKGDDVYMIYQGKRGQSWHPHLAEQLGKMEQRPHARTIEDCVEQHSERPW